MLKYTLFLFLCSVFSSWVLSSRPGSFRNNPPLNICPLNFWVLVEIVLNAEKQNRNTGTLRRNGGNTKLGDRVWQNRWVLGILAPLPSSPVRYKQSPWEDGSTIPPCTLGLATRTKTPVTHLVEVAQIQISKVQAGLDSAHISTSLPFEYHCKTPGSFPWWGQWVENPSSD